jgi:CRP-like cAMP-binding protein
MYIVKSELFKNVDPDTVEAIWGEGKERTFDKGELVFSQGEQAYKFYVLGEGSVHLTMGSTEELCFVVDRSGEVFGWSALVEPYEYQASARCTAQSRLLEIPREVIEKVARAHPQDGIIIFRNLSGIVTVKLCNSYQQRISDTELKEMESAQRAKIYGG